MSIALLPSADRLVQSLQLLVGVEVDHESAATPSTIELDLGPQRLAEPLLQGSNVRALEPPLPGPRPREAHLLLAPDPCGPRRASSSVWRTERPCSTISSSSASWSRWSAQAGIARA